MNSDFRIFSYTIIFFLFTTIILKAQNNISIEYLEGGYVKGNEKVFPSESKSIYFTIPTNFLYSQRSVRPFTKRS